MPELSSIEGLQRIDVNVNGPGSADRLIIFGGIARFDWHRANDDSWLSEPLTITISDDRNRMIWTYRESEPRFPAVVDSVATVSLAGIRSRESIARDIVGFAVERATAFFPIIESDFPQFGIQAQLAIRGKDVDFQRVSFQLNVLARSR